METLGEISMGRSGRDLCLIGRDLKKKKVYPVGISRNLARQAEI